jgi:hypothetical protein
MLSDLSSRTSQIVVQIARNTPVFNRIFLSADYTFLHSRSEHRGLESSTAGDPFLKSQGYGDVPTHIFHIRASTKIGWIQVATVLALMSGTPFTPLIAGDINGDGLSGNDRAFIFDPSNTNDVVLAGQLSQLLDNSTTATRKCLQRQFGQIAGLNSCRTGWHIQPIVNIAITDPEQGLSAWDRLQFSVATVNVMSGVLRLLGLSNTSLGRAVNPPSVDPTLLYVDGFDPATQQFRYRVNQQFGDRRTQQAAATRAPFQVFLKGQLTFGFPARNRLVKMLFSSQGDAPITQQSARAQLLRLTANPLATVLELRDSLDLSSQQIATLKQQELYFQQQADSIYTPLVKLLVDKQQKISDRDLMTQLGPIRFALEVLMKQMIEKKVAAVLDVSQQQLLPHDLKRFLPTPTKAQ